MAPTSAKRKVQASRAYAVDDSIYILAGDELPWEKFFDVPIGSKYYQTNGVEWKKVSAGPDPADWQESLVFAEQIGTQIKAQIAHGFTVTNRPLPAYIDAVGNFQLAQSNSELTLSAVYITKIIDVDSFEYVSGNVVLNYPGHGLDVGEFYFLSPDTPAGITDTVAIDGIQDVCFYILDATKILTIDNLPLNRDTFYNPMLRLINSDDSDNLNSNSQINLVELNQVDYNDQGFYTVSGTGGITPAKTGRYKIDLNIHTNSNSNRTNLEVSFAINGTRVGPVAASGYIRNASGHNRSSYHLSDAITISDTDVLTVSVQREGGGGTITLADVGTSSLIIERIR